MEKCAYRLIHSECDNWVCECYPGPYLMFRVCPEHHPKRITCDKCGVVYFQRHPSETPSNSDNDKVMIKCNYANCDNWVCKCSKKPSENEIWCKEHEIVNK